MKLYYAKGAASLAVRIVINEMNLSCDFEAVDLNTKITETGDNFFNITPKGYVPLLKIDTETLTETSTILQHLADCYNATSLLPIHGDINRYRVLEWTNFIATELHKNCAMLLNANIPEEIKNLLFNTGLTTKLNMVNNHLANHHYLIENQFTIADAYLFTVLFWVPRFLKKELSPWPHMLNYFERLKNRISIQNAFRAEMLEINM